MTATVYSILPSGLETTIKLKIGDEVISSIVFGAAEYGTDEVVHCSIVGNNVCIFNDKEDKIAMGELIIK